MLILKNKNDYATTECYRLQGYEDTVLVDFNEFNFLGYTVDLKNKKTIKAIDNFIKRKASFGKIVETTYDETNGFKRSVIFSNVIIIKFAYFDKKLSQIRALVKQISDQPSGLKFKSKTDEYKLEMSADWISRFNSNNKIILTDIICFNLVKRNSPEFKIEYESKGNMETVKIDTVEPVMDKKRLIIRDFNEPNKLGELYDTKDAESLKAINEFCERKTVYCEYLHPVFNSKSLVETKERMAIIDIERVICTLEEISFDPETNQMSALVCFQSGRYTSISEFSSFFKLIEDKTLVFGLRGYLSLRRKITKITTFDLVDPEYRDQVWISLD